jgi:hypothetical protein
MIAKTISEEVDESAWYASTCMRRNPIDDHQTPIVSFFCLCIVAGISLDPYANPDLEATPMLAEVSTRDQAWAQGRV